ncbi:MAG: hypothetical protein DRQ02_12585, partial [Candidatus Latescibacterota bacterium]
MRTGNIFFDIVVNQVTVAVGEVIAHDGFVPENIEENFELEREIEQIMLKAVGTKAIGAILRVGVD